MSAMKKLADANSALISDTGARLRFAISTQGQRGLRDNLARFRAIAEAAVAERDAVRDAARDAADAYEARFGTGRKGEAGLFGPIDREMLALRAALKEPE